MKMLLSAMFALILVVSLLVPVFTMADETDLNDAAQSPSSEISPSPSGEASPIPSEEASLSPSDEASPSSSEDVSPNPSDDASPSPSEEASPSPSGEVSPGPSDDASPSPSEEVSPSPSTSPNPYEGITDPTELYDIFIALETSEEIDQYMDNLSDEQRQALEEYMASQTENSSQPETIPFTDAGPLVNPVSNESRAKPSPALRRSLSSAVSTAPSDVLKSTDGVILSKDIIRNSDTDYTVKLESYTTGKLSTVPCDIVLVLDQSGSMVDNFDGSSTRQGALKTALNTFLSQLNGQNVDHHVAIVTFSDSAQQLSVKAGGKNKYFFSVLSDYTFLSNYINGNNAANQPILGTPVGATNTDQGMSSAYTLLSGLTGTGRNKVVVLFTDGIPTEQYHFNTTIATSAISYAKSMKDLNATVYSVGIFGGANASQLYGTESYFTNRSNGTYNTFWDITEKDINFYYTKASIPAANRFLNFISSNYLGAENLGLTKYSDYNVDPDYKHYTNYEKFMINIPQAFDRNTKGNYYLAASNASQLSAVFANISFQIDVPAITLGNSTAVKDIVSQYFNAPTDIGQISVYTVDCLGKTGDTYSWSDTMVSFTATKAINARTITVSGFSYDDNYVTAEVKPSSGGHGKKLVIFFNITVREGFWGGNLVPTNGNDSGLYASDALVGNFTRPTANIPLNVPFSAKDFSIYLGTSVNSSELYNAIAPTEEWQDDYVNTAGITYSPTGQTNNLTADKTDTTVTATVGPLYSGSVGSVTLSDTSTICVFKPVITYSDSQIYLGEKPTYPASLLVAWVPPAGVTPAPVAPLGSAPALTASYSPNVAWFMVDTPVNATINAGSWDITNFVTFANNGVNHAGNSATCEFTVRLKTCILTVSKNGISGTYGNKQTFIFHITGANIDANHDYADEVDLTVVVSSSNTSKQIVGLPVGIYTITEAGGWSWRYTAAGSAPFTLSKDTDTFGVTNTLDRPKWLSGSNFASNLFAAKAG